MYFLNHFNMKGGGALAALILGMAVSQMWARGWPAPSAKRPDMHYAHRSGLSSRCCMAASVECAGLRFWRCPCGYEGRCAVCSLVRHQTLVTRADVDSPVLAEYQRTSSQLRF